MKVLKGSLQETLYGWPDEEKTQHGVSDPPIVRKETRYKENEVAYIQGTSKQRQESRWFAHTRSR